MANQRDPSIKPTERFAGVKPVNLKTDHADYVLDRCRRAEEVGMFDTSVVFKDVYEGELVPNFDSKDREVCGFVYEFKHLLIESPNCDVSIDQYWYNGCESRYHYIDITGVTNYGEDYKVLIRRDDINEAFRSHLIDSIFENLILFNRLVEDKYVKGAIINKKAYESYNAALRCVIFYNAYVVPKLNVQPLVMFEHKEDNGRLVVHVA